MFGWGRSCPTDGAGNTAQVSLESMGGLFVVSGVLAGISLVLAVVSAAQRRWCASGNVGADEEMDHTATEGEMLRALLRKVDYLGNLNDFSDLSDKDSSIKVRDVQDIPSSKEER